MEKLKKMKECLECAVEHQIHSNLKDVDAKELGEAVDMIKDLAEAIYYCTITEAMEEDDEKKTQHHGMMYYSPKRYPIEYYDPRYREKASVDMPPHQKDGERDKYPSDGSGEWRDEKGTHHDARVRYPATIDHIYRDGMMRDPHEGKSGQRRKMYMDGKGVKAKDHQMRELESYMQELSDDIVEMIQDASPEEKNMLSQKISLLASKIK